MSSNCYDKVKAIVAALWTLPAAGPASSPNANQLRSVTPTLCKAAVCSLPM